MSDSGTSAVAKKEEEELLESSLSSGAARKRAPPGATSSGTPLSSSPLSPSKKRPALATLACDGDGDGDDDAGAAAPNSSITRDEFQGITFSSISPGSEQVVSEIDRIKAADIAPEIFFERYIAARRPCVLLLDGNKNNTSNNSRKYLRLMTLQDLKSLDGADTLVCQVERRPDAQTPFGQNRTMPNYMQELSLTTILERLQDDSTKHLYYLSTQQQQQQESTSSVAKYNNNKHHHEHDDNDSDDAVVTLPAGEFSPLTLKLVQAGLIQDHVPLAGNLILESCHLWMGGGCGSGGSSSSSSSANSGSASSHSGLHHDFHDNFYQLQAGRKRFTLYPPNAAIPVYGQRECMHANGLISYRSNPTRADGAPLSLCQQQKSKTDAAAMNDNDDDSDDKDDDADDEEEIVLGKGFDYQSDTDDEDNGAAGVNFDDEEAAVDDYDALFGEQKLNGNNDDSNEEAPKKKAAVAMTTTASTIENGANKKKQAASSDDDSRRPDSFSPVNLSLDPEELYAAFPIMKNTSLVPPPAIVEIQAGECLYLPASWFHCVESFADNDSNSSDGVHMAVNYWYHPPDRLDHFADPYQHDFWKRKTQKKV